MISPLLLGSQPFHINLIQGPLAGISSAPFRALFSQYQQPAYSCTEMISCQTIVHQPTFAYQRFIKKLPQEGKLCVQLSANDPIQLAEATKRVTDFGVDLIDLNCGCPVKKIRKKGAGSKLLTDPQKIYSLICAMKNNTHLPVSIKIRVQGNSDDLFHSDLVKAINDSNLDFLIVHGRHFTEKYDTPCHYDDIEYFVNEINKPVIGNGDISCIASLKRMLATGCKGVMIARATVGQPWLIEQLLSEINGMQYTLPSFAEIGNVFIQHVSSLTQLLGNETMAIMQARKLGKYYGIKIQKQTEFLTALEKCRNMQSFNDLINHYFTASDTKN